MEKEFESSVSPVLDTFKNFRYKNKLINVETLYVNMSTLIRNNIDKKETDDEVINDSLKDLDDLIHGYASYTNMNPNISNPVFIVYVPNYLGFLSIHQRPLSKTRERVTKLTNILSKQIRKDERPLIYRGLRCYNILVGSKMLPFRDLYNQTRDIYRQIKKETNSFIDDRRTCAILSHVPLDYHLYKYTRDLYIVESFTGNIKTYVDLNQKIFKDPNIPFNRYTHLAFGDNVFVKPILLRKHRAEMLEKARKERWNLMTEEQIKTSISNSGIPTTFLTTIKI